MKNEYEFINILVVQIYFVSLHFLKKYLMLDFLVEYGYWGLFIASFLAATILPFSSDIVFLGLLYAGADPIPCLALATLGNWMGGMTNYYLGRLGKLEWIEKYLKIKPEKIFKMQKWLEGKGGAFMAFFSWLPAIGDLMAVALGYMRANKAQVAIFMFVGKGLRYIVEMILLHYGVQWVGIG